MCLSLEQTQWPNLQTHPFSFIFNLLRLLFSRTPYAMCLVCLMVNPALLKCLKSIYSKQGILNCSSDIYVVFQTTMTMIKNLIYLETSRLTLRLNYAPESKRQRRVLNDGAEQKVRIKLKSNSSSIPTYRRIKNRKSSSEVNELLNYDQIFQGTMEAEAASCNLFGIYFLDHINRLITIFDDFYVLAYNKLSI